MIFEDRVYEIINRIIEEKELPDKSIDFFENSSSKGTNKGMKVSESLCISEPDYPIDRKKRQNQNRSFVIMNIKKQSNIELLIRMNQFDYIEVPDDAIVKQLKSDKAFIHVFFDEKMKSLYEYIEKNILFCLNNYESSSNFACCSKYLECSHASKCLHENKLYSKGCAYRGNLEKGNVFFV